MNDIKTFLSVTKVKKNVLFFFFTAAVYELKQISSF